MLIRDMHSYPGENHSETISSLFEQLSISHFATNQIVTLSEKYLNDPNSPIRNEELYTLFLKEIIASEMVDKDKKKRYNHQLKMALKNRVGQVAANFEYTLKDGSKSTLHATEGERILLIFNNPTCGECARQKVIISHNPQIFDNSRITILSIYPDEDLEAWHENSLPEEWIDGCNKGLSDRDLYDLKAIPTIYLLDQEKRVILKDASIIQVMQHLLQFGNR